MAAIKSGQELTGDYKKGFLDKGLWAVSRHPKYFAEQAIWVCFYLFSVAAGGQWFNWSTGDGDLYNRYIFLFHPPQSRPYQAGNLPSICLFTIQAG